MTYAFPSPQAALIFDSAHGPTYRVNQWIADAPATLRHLAGLDALLFPAPAQAAGITIHPPLLPTEGSLAFVPFSDGSHALWTGQLGLLTAEDADAVAALQGNLGRWKGQQPDIELDITSDVPLLGPDGHGTRLRALVSHGGGPYLYAGPPGVGDMVVDPGLPSWVQSAFRERMPAVNRVLTQAWGDALPATQLMLAWGGGTGAFKNRGRASGRQVVMHVQGEDYLQPNADLLANLAWFFAHEMTHLHQFADGGHGDAWMDEGFADTLATDALVALGMWDRAHLERRYWSVARECARELSRGPLEGARGRVTYVCGDLAGVALLNMLPRGSLPALWTAARRGQQRVGLARLLLVAREAGAPPPALAALETFVTARHADADGAIRKLLEDAGLQPRYDESNNLGSMAFPFSGMRRHQPAE